MKNNSQQTYEVLKRRIVAGHYTAGGQLKESHIAADLGLSRTPVRAALKRLVEDGLAVSEGRRGVFVASWTRWDIEDMFRLRIRLEPYAARLAAERADAEVITQLQHSNERMARAMASIGRNPDAIADVQAANSEFHRLILQAAGSYRLQAVLEGMIDMPVIMRSFFLYDAPDVQRSLQHHRDLTLAVEWGNGDLAEQIMSVHLTIASRRFMSQRLDSAPFSQSPENGENTNKKQ